MTKGVAVAIVWPIVFGLVALGGCRREGASASARDDRYARWAAYGANDEGNRYSSLRQITPENVARLTVAWTYETGDAFEGSELQCNPLVIGDVLYATTPKLRLIALDADTGRLRWRFDPFASGETIPKLKNRGLMYWRDESAGAQASHGRLFYAVRHWLYAIDTETGRPVEGFGQHGRIDLREGLGRPPGSFNVSITTPGVVYKDLLIVGSITSEELPAAPGDIRAYDVRTGAPRWSFHTIPHPGEFGYDTWPPDAWTRSGGANNWSGMTIDRARGLVFASTGSAAFDFYGGDRLGDNLFANSLLALKAETGERVWHFQFVRHDVWDRDPPAPPNLVTLRRDGKTVDAVAQITKSGHVFVFERETGKPVFPIDTRRVPASDVPGERLAEEQSLPLAPPPIARQQFTEDLVTERTPQAREAVLKRLRAVRSGPQFTPPSMQGTVIFPGFDGGGEWGGAAYDPSSRLLYVNANEMAWILRLEPREAPAATSTTTATRVSGRTLYLERCASCHKPDRRGTPPEFPSLVDVAKRKSAKDIEDVIRNGGGRMPAAPGLSDDAIRAIVAYVLTGESQVASSVAPASSAKVPAPLPYRIDGYNRFFDPDGYPAVKPPWGTLNAIDLNAGTIRWTIPFGEYPELVAKGVGTTGSENYGGPAITATGLLFIGATNYDRAFRAFDARTGRLLWSTQLPAGGNATPAIYESRGRQFVVIAAGGGKSNQPSGGKYVAFALP